MEPTAPEPYDFRLVNYPNKDPVTKDQIHEAIIICNGNIAAVCRLLERNREGIMSRINADTTLRMVLSDIRDAVMDAAENNIFSLVYQGDFNASKFVLQTLGKDRGYITRVENTGKDGKNIHEGMTTELAKLLDGIAARIDAPGSSPEVSDGVGGRGLLPS